MNYNKNFNSQMTHCKYRSHDFMGVKNIFLHNDMVESYTKYL